MRRLAGLFGIALACCASQAAAERPLFRIFSENTPTHIQTRIIERFVEEVRRRGEGRIEVQFHHSAELFRDRDAIAALRQDRVEMIVPGTWQLDRYAPDTGIFLLPVFYGRTTALNDALRDGPVGARINRAIERELPAIVLGRWIDLGFAQIYTVARPVARLEDLAGMRIRIAGGEANAARLRALGAEPVVIPWPDLPQQLRQGAVDGVLTTHATVESAGLWEDGIRHTFEDREYFAQYVPLVSARFWNRLDPALQALLREAWEGVVDRARRDAAEAQAAARAELQRHGITVVVPDESTLAAGRQRMLAVQGELVRYLEIDPGLVEEVERQFGDRP